MSDILKRLEQIPTEKRLEFTNAALWKMICSVLEKAFKKIGDTNKFANLIEESGRRAGENFARCVIAKYDIEVCDSPSAMMVMNIASFFDESCYDITESTKRMTVKKLDAIEFANADLVSADVVGGMCCFLRGYYDGAVNAGEKKFLTKFDCAADAEGKLASHAIVEDPSGPSEEKWVDIPERVKEMSRRERLEEKKRYFAFMVGHIEIVLLETFGFEEASKISNDATYPVGLENGIGVRKMFDLGDTPEDVYLVHFISSYMMGIKTEKTRVTDDMVVYSHHYCPFRDAASMTMEYLNITDPKKREDSRFVICEGCKGHASGLTHSISPDWTTYSPKRLSSGDPYCSFLISKEK